MNFFVFYNSSNVVHLRRPQDTPRAGIGLPGARWEPASPESPAIAPPARHVRRGSVWPGGV